ncbi:putative polygalacturonate 4-alpha-galacturonosyltransferase [Helianthus annuus]|nr:putative polygalacturonate 4-alpha-galacturonosyltransferase [Helianthus annuus]KAJ0446859.1 putative polygalacturonate 4-alpha-galacturonosyltransferase [Helianthus annuus]KAJ0631753.1 putative polygalacturonate 4-alpha-galacturonosyltransferase [Helianthus annuus]
MLPAATISDADTRSDFPINLSATKHKLKRLYISPPLSTAMKSPITRSTTSLSPLTIFIFLVLVHISIVGADAFDSLRIRREINGKWPMFDCPQCMDKKEQANANSLAVGNHKVEKDIDIIVTYTDTSGAIKIRTVKSKDLSASWVWKNPIDDNQSKAEDSKPETRFEHSNPHSSNEHVDINEQPHKTSSLIHPAKHKRRALRQERRDRRTAELIQVSQKMMTQMEEAAIERAKTFDTSVKGRYGIWRKEYESPNSDSTVKLMRDQIIMAKAYASIAKAKNETVIYDSLMKHSKRSQQAIEKATFDSELAPSAVDRAKEMGHILALAKDQFYDCIIMARKLRVMLQSTEANVDEVKKKSASLTQLAAKTLPKPLHCLPLVLTTDYFLLTDKDIKIPDKRFLEDPSLYHYAIFSDNVLATSVVVNSTVLHAKEPEKHVFHIVTDKLNFAAMKMWFLVNHPEGSTIEVQNVDDFTWLNASYCPVLRQLESSRMREYYFKAHQTSSLTAGSDNLKYRNPKYLSMLNHLRFYLPEVYPKLDKILFLDDDIVVQKDLTPLWNVDLQGMVNGAVETCKESFHRFDKYLNFSNPKIADNFEPNACGWAFGMNMFDLKEWKKRDITGIYHGWQNMNEERTLWKLGTLPPGLITFYNLTHPLERSWHVLGLGYDPALNQTEIENAAVVHYNGNYKPWLDLAISKYRSYWSRYVKFDNPYLQMCNINSFMLS